MQYCTVMAQPPDLITSAQASQLLPPTASGKVRRIEPYHRYGRIKPAMRAGSGKRSPLLYHRADVVALRDQLIAGLETQLSRVKS